MGLWVGWSLADLGCAQWDLLTSCWELGLGVFHVSDHLDQ